MSMQQFCLRWNNHQPNFISVFSSLLHNESLVDVTLAAEGRQLQAHKVVLSACSSYFQSLFTTNPCQHPIVILKDVQYSDLKTMVDFMYYGEVNVSQDQLPHVLKTAEMLKIKGLAEMPEGASVTKTENSCEQTDQLTSGSGTDSMWGSNESQQQYQQQQQQQQQMRRSPSPVGVVLSSPSTQTTTATRRKRLRKASTGSGSADRTSDDQHIDNGANVATLGLSQIDPMFGGGAGATSSSGGGGNLVQNMTNPIKILKESSNSDNEGHHHHHQHHHHQHHQHHDSSQEGGSAEDHHLQQNVIMPIDITGSTTPTDHGGGTTVVTCSPQQQTHAAKCYKRGRHLMRQSRVVKREPLDSTAPLQSSSGHDSPNSLQVRTQWRQIDATDEAIYHHRLLSVTPPKIERHASEPAPSLKVSSPHLLTVPSSPTMGGGMPFLVKQHSHPLLPSQQSMSMGGSMDMPSPPSSAYTLHRQMSQPDPILLPMVSSGGSSSGGIPVSSSISQLVATTLKCDDSESGLMMLSKNNSPTIVVVTDSGSPLTPASDCPIRVKTEELQRSASTPHTLTRELSFESRSQHCPVIRPGPALGCNFCWNTIDNHGRILRRKTKYHCPECQTNLCIVPCFQQYHERKTTEEASQSSSMQPNNNETSSKPSFGSSGAPSLRHHHKTGSL